MTNEEQLKSVQAQLALLTAQNGELGARLTLQSLQQGTQTELARLDALREKEAASAGFARDKARAMEPFGTVQGLKEALAAAAVAGREGSLSIAKGGDGTLLLRGKGPMFEALDRVAACLVSRLPAQEKPWRVAAAAEVEAALQSRATVERLRALNTALAPGGPAPSGEAPPSLTAALAGLQTTMLALNAVSDAGRFFRVDRQAQVFEGGDQAQRALVLLLEARSTPQRGIERAAADAADIAAVLQELHDLLLELDGRLRAAGTAAAPHQAAAAAQARSLIDALGSGSARPDALWALAAGEACSRRLKGYGRIELRATAQTVQVLERRTWRSDRLVAVGAAEVEYRIVDAKGALLRAGIELDGPAGTPVRLDGTSMHLELPVRPAAARHAAGPVQRVFPPPAPSPDPPGD